MQVFVSDKKRSKEFGGSEAFNRIKKELVKEMKGVGSEEQVLLVGCSAAPHMCVKKDEKAFINFFDKHLYLPLPDYASRLVCGPSPVALVHSCMTMLLLASVEGRSSVALRHNASSSWPWNLH